MKRRIFNILAAVSLVLCVATALFWMRSVWKWDRLGWTRWINDYQHWEAESADGGLCLSYICYPYMGQMETFTRDFGGYSRWRRGDLVFESDNVSAYASEAGETIKHFPWRSFGFDIGVNYFAIGGWRWVVVPYWFIFAIFSLLPMRSFWLVLRRRNRVSNALCSACGYDLRATPERCPECGTVPTQKAIDEVLPMRWARFALFLR